MNIQRSARKPAQLCGLLAILWTSVTLCGCGGGNAPPSPGAVTALAANSVEAGAPTAAFVPVTGVNGTPPYTFSVNPSLPTGLSLNSSTGAVSGAAASALASTTYAVTVRDTNSLTATADFTLTVTPGVSATTAIAASTAVAYTTTSPFTPATAANGTAPYTYSISPALPAGMTLNSSTGAISGTPTAVMAQSVYTVSVKDAKSASASSTFDLTVNIPTFTPLVVSTSVASTTVVSGPAITPFTPVTASGGFGSLTYSVSPALPAGLSMNSATGAISGSSTLIYSPQSSYTVTVSDVLSTPLSATFTLAVNPGPLAAATAVPAVTVATGTTLTPVIPVTGAGGFPPYTYSIAAGTTTANTGTGTVAVPPVAVTGLSLDPNSGTLSGTAASTIGAAPYTVTVTDANPAGASSSSASFQLTTLPTGYMLSGGLTWAPPGIVGATVTHAYALGTLCAGTINGTTGWRLPLTAELTALYTSIKNTNTLGSVSGYLQSLGWPTTSAYYWASDTSGSAGTFNRVNLSNDTISSQGSTSSNYASCVHS